MRPLVVSFLLFFSITFPVFAQSHGDACIDAGSVSVSSRHWAAPLDRRITIADRSLPLDKALMRLAAVAKLNLSFSTDLLPSGRVTCMSYRNTSVGDVLAYMLRDSDLAATVVGSDQIVVARVRNADAAGVTNGDAHVVDLGRILGTADIQHAVPAKSPSFSVTVLDATSAGWRQGGSLIELLNTNVPGMWLWAAGEGVSASYGSTRGGSSFGISAPKILIDGIEVANPQLLSHLTMDGVERIEIIRGPQGSPRYGADALNGVTNIITRHDTSSVTGAHIHASSTFGIAATRYGSDNGAVTQDHAVRLQAGRASRSFDVDVAAGSIGAYAPGAGARHVNADASFRLLGARTMLTGSMRYLAQAIDTSGATAALSALGDANLAAAFSDAAVTEALSLHEFTAGFNASFAQSARWSHALVVGVDGYRLGGVSFDSALTVTPADIILRDAGTNGIRVTLRGNSVAHFTRRGVDATVTFTADHTHISQKDENLPDLPTERESGNLVEDLSVADATNGIQPIPQFSLFGPIVKPPVPTQVRTSSGASTELSATFLNHLSLTGAVRVEHDAGGSAGDGHAIALPMFGASYQASAGAATLKAHASFGKGIRWPALTGLRDHMQLSQLSLDPEQQSGYDAGADFDVGRSIALQATYFDQTATGLAQQVTLPATNNSGDPNAQPRFGVELQNVGAISNTGWEMQATLRRGDFSLASAFTLLDSRVVKVAEAYTGDLRMGDRPLAVPARTLSVTAGVTRTLWSASLTAYRAADWINYNRIAMAEAEPANASAAIDLRNYWMKYSGFTHLGFNVSRALRGGIVASVGASNLLNNQIGEPDNVTIVPGRAYSLGLRAIF